MFSGSLASYCTTLSGRITKIDWSVEAALRVYTRAIPTHKIHPNKKGIPALTPEDPHTAKQRSPIPMAPIQQTIAQP